MSPPVLSVLPAHDPAAIEQAAAHLKAGGLLGLPTETVYGLAADACNDAAVAAIFATKGRPANHPLIVHVAAPSDAEKWGLRHENTGDEAIDSIAHFASHVPAFAQQLMAAFWPGPLTLILPRRAGVAAAAAGGQDSVGLRCPAHPVAQALLAACAAQGVPGLAAPSANRFGRVSPTTAAHVQAEFGDAVPVLDGGPCAVGIESTIIDCTRGAPVLLRPGHITRAEIERALGLPLQGPGAMPTPAPRASGTLAAHYAPRAKVRLMDARALRTALKLLGADAAHIAIWSQTVLPIASARVIYRRMPADAQAAAQQLFAVLRGFDDAGVKLIWIEPPPDTPEWEGVRDRLARAAA